MPLKLKRRPGSPNWHIHGTVCGELVRESSGVSDRAAAERIKAAREDKLHRESLYGPAVEATFASACHGYLSECERPEYDRRQLARVLKTWIAKMRLSQINSGTVKRLAREMYPNVKPQSQKRLVVIPVRAVINWAHENGLCAHMRVTGFEAEGKKIKHAVDKEWIRKFRAHAPLELGTVALLMFQTGARPIEALSLTRGQLMLDEKKAVIPKTKAGPGRIMLLTDEVIELLKAFMPANSRAKIFPYENAKALAYPYKKACAAARIPHRTPYEAGRHSFATETVVRQKVDVVTAAKAGNFSAKMLLDNYAHAEGLDTFAEAVFGTKSAQSYPPKLRTIKKSRS